MINIPKVHHSVRPIFLRLGIIFLKYPILHWTTTKKQYHEKINKWSHEKP